MTSMVSCWSVSLAIGDDDRPGMAAAVAAAVAVRDGIGGADDEAMLDQKMNVSQSLFHFRCCCLNNLL